MKPAKESKEEKFIRLAEARVNKILAMLRLLGNLSGINYVYTMDQVEQIFTRLQLDLVKTKMRFLQPDTGKKHRFSLGKPYEIDEPAQKEQNPAFAIPLPDGSYLRAVGFPNYDYPCVNIYWDNGINMPTEPLCFAEFNPEREGNQHVCIGAYRYDQEDTAYYAPYMAERNSTNE